MVIPEHQAVIRRAAEAASVEPVRARVVHGSDPLPRYVVVTRTPAGQTNLAAIDPDFIQELREFELIKGDVDAALERRAREEADAIETIRARHAAQRCPRHPGNRASDCQPCELEAAERDESEWPEET